MTKQEIWKAVEEEMRKAKKKHPSWPDHIVAQSAVVAEEAGELVRAALQHKYERPSDSLGQQKQREEMRTEAIQVIVTAIRFLENN